MRTAFHTASIYRVDFWVGLLSSFIWMYAMHSLWTILFQQAPDSFGTSLDQMRTYGVLGILLLPIINTAQTTQAYIAERVRTGTLEMDLLKPLDFIFQMFCRNLADLGVSFATRSLPGFLLAWLFLDFQLPASWAAAGAFLVSLALGYLVFFAINVMMGMLAMVTMDIRSYSWAFSSLVRISSGQMVPLWLFPAWASTILFALPFHNVYYLPMSIYVGALEGSLVTALLGQVAWAVSLLVASRLIWLAAHRRVSIQGG